jgi:hypothetical protein
MWSPELGKENPKKHADAIAKFTKVVATEPKTTTTSRT